MFCLGGATRVPGTSAEARLRVHVATVRSVYVILAMGMIVAKAAEKCVGGACQA